jgi:hypothetical protein
LDWSGGGAKAEQRRRAKTENFSNTKDFHHSEAKGGFNQGKPT